MWQCSSRARKMPPNPRKRVNTHDMNIIARILTAWSRHHRSRGFGIHSPFGYRFVREVLRQRLPYYSYEAIEQLHNSIATMNSGRKSLPRAITVHNAKLLFRITNHFNPTCILQVGAGSGVASASMLAVSSTSHLWLCEGNGNEPHSTAAQVLPLYGSRVHSGANLNAVIANYEATLPPQSTPFVLIKQAPHGEGREALAAYLQRALAGCAVVIMLDVHRDASMHQLWHQVKQWIVKGQTYSNYKTAIVCATPKLQREDFVLWL